MRLAVFTASLAAALAVTAAPLPRAAADPPALLHVAEGALSVQADKLEIDVSAGEAILTGNVTLIKGDLKVSCPRIDLKFDSTPHVVWARGSGGVSADVRGVHAEGPDAELDLVKQVLELRGGVRLARGQGWLQAEQARIEIGSGKVTATQVKGSIPVPPRGP
jgi:lipopolysaccharide export system protein LptA